MSGDSRLDRQAKYLALLLGLTAAACGGVAASPPLGASGSGNVTAAVPATNGAGAVPATEAGGSGDVSATIRASGGSGGRRRGAGYQAR